MTRRNDASPVFRCAPGIVLLTLFASASSATVVYEYRELSSRAVIGTLEITAPPASIDSGWSSVDSSNLISLFLDDAVFGLGNDNLLLAGGAFTGFGVISLDGWKLDGGDFGIVFPTIVPPGPDDPTIDRTIDFSFDQPVGADFIGMASYYTFSDGSVIIGDLFVDGDWTAIPEPGTFALLGLGLGLAGLGLSRWRNAA